MTAPFSIIIFDHHLKNRMIYAILESNHRAIRRHMKGARMDTRGAGILRDFYGTVIDRAEQYLRANGFRRSGRSDFFYRIDAGRTKGCLIVFRRSIGNTPEDMRFGINHICASAGELDGGPTSSGVTVGLLKRHPALNGLGPCVHDVDAVTAAEVSPEAYFADNILPELTRIVSGCTF